MLATSAQRAGKRERNKAENRAAILGAARRVFAERGFEASTIRDVIGATELAAGTFYNYFPDKQSVLRAIFDEKAGQMQVRAREARRGANTVEDVVRSTLFVAFTMVAEDRELFELMQRNAGAIRSFLEEPVFLAGRDELHRDLDRMLRAESRTGIDAGYLAAAISGLAFEVAAVAADREPASVAAAADFATAFVLGGITGVGALSSISTPDPSRSRTTPDPAPHGASSRTVSPPGESSNRKRS